MSLRILTAAAAFLCLGTLAEVAPASAADQAAPASAAPTTPAAAPASAPVVEPATPAPIAEPAASPAPVIAPAAVAAPVATPAPAKPKDYVLSGFGDLSFTHLGGAGSRINGRIFDTANNYFNVQAINGTLVKNGTLSGKLEVNLGSDADVMASFGQPLDTGFNITQLYLGYTSGVINLTGGKFVTLAGAEVIRSGDNYNFSRSFLFGYAIPFTHTGLRASYAPTSTLTLTAGLNKGWDAVREKPGGGGGFEASAALTPTKKLAATASIYTGKEPNATGSGSTRNLLDLIGTYKATDKLTFVANYDTAGQKDAFLDSGASWRGFAGYANYQINSKFSGTLRGEVFNDPQGFRTGIPQVLRESTWTLGYTPKAPLLFRLEYRADRSSVPSLKKLDSTKQSSLAAEGIIKF